MHRNCKTLYIAANMRDAKASAARLRAGAGLVGVAVSILTLAGCGSGGTGSDTSADLGAGGATTGLTSSSSAVVTSSAAPTTPSTTAASTTASTAPTTAATAAQTCSDLTAVTVKLNGVAAGTSYWDVVVTNLGQAACILPPEPQFAVLGPNKKQLPVKVSGDDSGQSFRLEAGASAAMVVGYGSDGNSPCDVEPAYLSITPPGLDLAFDSGAKHCANDALLSEDWVAGKHADPH